MRDRLVWPALLLALALAGCTAGGGDPVSPGNLPDSTPEAAPASSATAPLEPVSTEPAALLPEDTGGDGAMTLWYWDGETCLTQTVFQPQKGELLADLSALTGQAEAGLTFPEEGPLWGLSLTRTEYDFEAAWRQGVWSDSEGRVLRAEVDFQALWDGGGGDLSQREVQGFPAGFPNQRNLALADGTWNPAFLTLGQEAPAPAGVTLELEADGSDGLTGTLGNSGTQTCFFGEGYELQAALEGVWYSVPYRDTGHYAFNSIGLTLRPGEIYVFQPWMDLWLPLPDGDYRICKSCGDGMAASAGFSVAEGAVQVP